MMTGMLRLWVLWLCAVLAGYSAASAAADVENTKSGQTILVFGDSLSSGYGLGRDEAWPALLTQRLKRDAPNYTVANASVTGETTSGGVRRIAGALAQYKPAIVIVELGGNDGLRGGNPEDMRRNLDTIINACRTAHAKVLLVGIRMPPNYGTAYAEKFHAVYGELAQRYKLALVPYLLEGFGDKAEWFQADGIHPAAKAEPIVLDLVWKGLRPLLATGR